MPSRPRRKVLAVDIGGSHVKLKCSPDLEKRKFVSGPELTAAEMTSQVLELSADWDVDVVSIGFPEPVIYNRPLAEPHNLGAGWVAYDFGKAFERPVKTIDDAAMQALGSYAGGRMLFLGLGTGLGSAMIVDGVLEPMELAHLGYKRGKTFEDCLGRRGLERLGTKRWRSEVAAVVGHLTRALEPEYIVLGGGNAPKLKALPPNTRLGDNENAFAGGFRLWGAPARGHD